MEEDDEELLRRIREGEEARKRLEKRMKYKMEQQQQKERERLFQRALQQRQQQQQQLAASGSSSSVPAQRIPNQVGMGSQPTNSSGTTWSNAVSGSSPYYNGHASSTEIPARFPVPITSLAGQIAAESIRSGVARANGQISGTNARVDAPAYAPPFHRQPLVQSYIPPQSNMPSAPAQRTVQTNQPHVAAQYTSSVSTANGLQPQPFKPQAQRISQPIRPVTSQQNPPASTSNTRQPGYPNTNGQTSATAPRLQSGVTQPANYTIQPKRPFTKFDLADMQSRISRWHADLREGAWFNFEQAFGWGDGWFVSGKKGGEVLLHDSNRNNVPITRLYATLATMLDPVPDPSASALSGPSSTSNLQVRESAPLKGQALTPESFMARANAGPVSTTSRMPSPAQANKKRLANDILNALGKKLRRTYDVPPTPAAAQNAGPSQTVPSTTSSQTDQDTPTSLVATVPASVSNPLTPTPIGPSPPAQIITADAGGSGPSIVPVASTPSPAPRLSSSPVVAYGPISAPAAASPPVGLVTPSVSDTTNVNLESPPVVPPPPVPSPDRPRVARKSVAGQPRRPSPATSSNADASSSRPRQPTPGRSSVPPPPTSASEEEDEPLFLPSSAPQSPLHSPPPLAGPSRNALPPKRKLRKMYVLVPPPPDYLKSHIESVRKLRKREQAGKGKERAIDVDDIPEQPPAPVEEDEYDYSYDSLGTAIDDEMERNLMNVACTRLQVLECKWEGCDAVLNSNINLFEHLRRQHRPEDFSPGGSYLCRWTQCGKHVRYGDRHLMKHAFDRLSCPYKYSDGEDCQRDFRSARLLIHHAANHTRDEDELRPSCRPVPLASLMLPSPLPASVYVHELERNISAPRISELEHKDLIGWIPKQVVGLSKPKHDRARRQQILPYPPPAEDDEYQEGPVRYRYEYLTDYTKRYGSNLSEPSDNLRHENLRTKEVSEKFKEGLVVFGESSEQEDEGGDVDQLESSEEQEGGQEESVVKSVSREGSEQDWSPVREDRTLRGTASPQKQPRQMEYIAGDSEDETSALMTIEAP